MPIKPDLDQKLLSLIARILFVSKKKERESEGGAEKRVEGCEGVWVGWVYHKDELFAIYIFYLFIFSFFF